MRIFLPLLLVIVFILAEQLKEAKKEVELYIYSENDHNLSQSFGLAMLRSVEFFNRYLKE